MKKLLKIEGIPKPGAIFYSAIVARSPVMKDFYRMVEDEVAAKMSSGRLLDIGTGPGYLPLGIAQRSPNLDIKAIDISPAMVEIARRNAREMGLSGRVEFLFGSAENIPFADGYFDLIVSTGSFHHWAEPKKCLKEIYRVLNNDGEAWIYDLRRDIAKEAKREARQRYGWLLSFIFLYFVRLHSSASSQQIQKLLSSPELLFTSKKVEERGVILKQELKK